MFFCCHDVCHHAFTKSDYHIVISPSRMVVILIVIPFLPCHPERSRRIPLGGAPLCHLDRREWNDRSGEIPYKCQYGWDVSTTVDMTSIFVISPSRSPKRSEAERSLTIIHMVGMSPCGQALSRHDIILRSTTMSFRHYVISTEAERSLTNVNTVGMSRLHTPWKRHDITKKKAEPPFDHKFSISKNCGK